MESGRAADIDDVLRRDGQRGQGRGRHHLLGRLNEKLHLLHRVPHQIGQGFDRVGRQWLGVRDQWLGCVPCHWFRRLDRGFHGVGSD